jgi:hypothetical protein
MSSQDNEDWTDRIALRLSHARHGKGHDFEAIDHSSQTMRAKILPFFVGAVISLLACLIFLYILSQDASTLSSLAIARGVCPLSTGSCSSSSSEDQQQQQQQQQTNIMAADTPNFLDFHLHQAQFTQTFAACVIDSNCRFIYHHVQKTAGTTIEDITLKLFYDVDGKTHSNSCCDNTVLERFNKNSISYCTKQKFQSYQVNGSTFENIVKRCMDIYTQQNQSQPQRVVVLTSYREPIARTLSSIHQVCNKNADRRSQSTLEFCDRCSYETDSEYWMGYVDRFNNDYEQLYDHVVRSDYLKSCASKNKMELLAIDSADVSRFFSQLKDALPVTYHAALEQPSVYNPEEKARCSFGVTSDMIKGLALSTDIYRNLTCGIY